MSHREKAQGLINIAFDEGKGTTKEERMTALLNAGKLIYKYDLLANPLDGMFDRIKEDKAFKASKKVVDTLSDPDLIDSLKTLGATLSGLGSRARDARDRRRRR